MPKPAPFLSCDSDPYLAIVDGKLLWIYDAYTTTTEYPYSQAIDLSDATDGLIGGSANYMRNSVKVTVDAYTGGHDVLPGRIPTIRSPSRGRRRSPRCSRR